MTTQSEGNNRRSYEIAGLVTAHAGTRTTTKCYELARRMLWAVHLDERLDQVLWVIMMTHSGRRSRVFFHF